MCKQDKPLAQFPNDKTRLYGKSYCCRPCEYQRVKDYPVRKAKHQARVQAYQLKFPKKFAATQAANAALKKGHLARQPCEVCGAERTDMHHDDYDLPLAVRWLCRPHHREHHDLFGEGKNAS